MLLGAYQVLQKSHIL